MSESSPFDVQHVEAAAAFARAHFKAVAAVVVLIGPEGSTYGVAREEGHGRNVADILRSVAESIERRAAEAKT